MSKSTPLAHPVTVIIPVYRGINVTRNCIHALIESGLPTNTGVVLIDDASPEPELSEYCAAVAAEQGFRLIVNEHNLGFVASANLGLGIDSSADTILLNSDTEVSGDWISRLQDCAYRTERAGTVTPFSNNGTICSYPVFTQPNELPPGWSTGDLDRAFQQSNPAGYVELPTAVGFCMYIRRDCLAQTGLFDVESFGQGYGEECDFSLRASKLGWKHLLAADVFVFHEGGASFSGATDERKLAADRVMDRLHPEYDALINDFIRRDPPAGFRSAVDMLRVTERPGDLREVLAEQVRQANALRERLEKMMETVKDLRGNVEELEVLLNESRKQFEATDRALVNAQGITRQQQEDLKATNDYARSLLDHIEKMEQSRSWRYTAWMRRK